jgi:hypothetical protein
LKISLSFDALLTRSGDMSVIRPIGIVKVDKNPDWLFGFILFLLQNLVFCCFYPPQVDSPQAI